MATDLPDWTQAIILSGPVTITGPVTVKPTPTEPLDITGPITVKTVATEPLDINGPVSVNVTQLPTPPGAITGILTVRRGLTGIAAPIQAATTFPLKTGLIVKAEAHNAGPAYTGGSTVTTSSFRLTPGESVLWPVDNAKIIWAIGTTGDFVSFGGA